MEHDVWLIDELELDYQPLCCLCSEVAGIRVDGVWYCEECADKEADKLVDHWEVPQAFKEA